MGYHKKDIKKGVLGEFSKIQEEVEELEDAIAQGNKVLALCELCDIVGAIDFYLRENFPKVSIADLYTMSAANEDAFKDGTRRSN
jgi:hypothetical protein